MSSEQAEDCATVDHIKPRSKYGSNQKENTVLACFVCNSIKGHMTAQEFAEFMTTEKFTRAKIRLENKMRKNEEKRLTGSGIATRKVDIENTKPRPRQ